MAGDGPILIFRVAANVGFIELDDIGVDALDLAPQDAGDGHGKIGGMAVMAVREYFGEHVRAGAGEFERVSGQGSGQVKIARQIERALAISPVTMPAGSARYVRPASERNLSRSLTEKRVPMPSIRLTK